MAASKVTATGLTDQQRAAIQGKSVSVALSAGAGCGKTFVLTERFLSHLRPAEPGGAAPAELKQLIAITFTERAAREMRDRIRGKCLQCLQSAAAADVPYWTRLLRELDAARVSTIHSFCGSLLRQHAAEAGLDPRFGMLEQTQADTLLAEAADDQFRELLSQRDETMLGLCVQFGLERLREMTVKLLSERQEIVFADWRERRPDEIVELWRQHHRTEFLPAALNGLIGSAASQAILRVLAANPQVDNAEMQRRLIALPELLKHLENSTAPLNDLNALRECTMVKAAGSKKSWTDPAAYDEFFAAAKLLRTEIDDLLPNCQFDAEAVLPDAAAGLQILSLAERVLAAYNERKGQLGLLDFNDLLIRAADLLNGQKELAERISRQVKLLLVDEFQDTDPVQVALVKAICGGGLRSGKLFFVGDFKQSIYRFRGAKPKVFRQLEDEMPAAGRLPLTLNFRSQPAVLQFVNALFCEEFEQYAPLQAHRPQRTPAPTVEFLWTIREDEKRAKGAVERGRRQEAQAIARRIRQLLSDAQPRVIDAADTSGETLRPVQPGDICILFRALSDVALYERALQDEGIDYYLVGGHAFYAQQEIFDLLNLLRSLVSPADEVSLAGVLRSPMFALADETLFWLTRQTGGLSTGLFAAAAPSELDAEQCRRVKFAAETLHYLRARKDRLPIAQLIDEALTRMGYDAALLAEFLGARKLANLRKLIAQARANDHSGALGLADFIVQLADLVAEQPKEALAATHPESSQVVRLMTIHQAKGLEFPVVIVADVDRPKIGFKDAIAFSPHLGPLVRVPNSSKANKLISGLDLFKQQMAEEDDQEQARLLYVATTRAADMLILSSSLQALDKLQGPWTRLLAQRFDLSSGACLARLPAGYQPPKIAVRLPAAEKPAPSPHARRVDWHALFDGLAAAGKLPVQQLPLVAPLEPARDARREYSFSRLNAGAVQVKHAVDDAEEELLAAPSTQIDPIGLGTLVHAALAELDFRKSGDISALVKRCAEQQPGSLEEETPVATELIGRFAASARAKRLAAAAEVHRELEFLLAWPPDDPAADGLRLRGFIDCLYRDAAGRWHLLDYKTNRATAASLADKAEPYRLQLLVYALAAETVLGQPPASLTLHFLRPGLEFGFDWDEAARGEVRRLVNHSLRQMV